MACPCGAWVNCPFLGWISINFALGHLAGTNVSVTLLSQTIITAILAIIILGETITSTKLPVERLS